MTVNLKSNKLLIFLVIMVLLISIPLTLSLVKQRQEIGEGAFNPEEGKIEIVIIPEGNVFSQEFPSLVNIKLVNTDSVPRQIYAAGLDLSFDPNNFDIFNVLCNTSFFSKTMVSRVDQTEGKVYLSCSKSGGESPLIINSGSSIFLGTFQIKISKTAIPGQTLISGVREVIPDAQTFHNMVVESPRFSYDITISPPPVPTDFPLPTSTPLPLPTSSPTMTPTLTPTPLPSPTAAISPSCPSSCPKITSYSSGKEGTTCWVEISWKPVANAQSYKIWRNNSLFRETTQTTYRWRWLPCNNNSLYKVQPLAPGCPEVSCGPISIRTPYK